MLFFSSPLVTAAAVGITVLLLNASLAPSYTPVPTQVPKVCKVQAKLGPLMSAGICMHGSNSQYKNLFLSHLHPLVPDYMYMGNNMKFLITFFAIQLSL